MGLSAVQGESVLSTLLPEWSGWYTLITRGLEGQQHLGLCEQEHSQQIKQVQLLSSASQTTPSSVTQCQIPKLPPRQSGLQG